MDEIAAVQRQFDNLCRIDHGSYRCVFGLQNRAGGGHVHRFIHGSYFKFEIGADRLLDLNGEVVDFLRFEPGPRSSDRVIADGEKGKIIGAGGVGLCFPLHVCREIRCANCGVWRNCASAISNCSDQRAGRLLPETAAGKKEKQQAN